MPDLHIVLYIAWKAAFNLLQLIRCADESGITQTALVVHTIHKKTMHMCTQQASSSYFYLFSDLIVHNSLPITFLQGISIHLSVPAAGMTEFHCQHISDPGLTLLVEQILTLSKAAVLTLRHLHWLALGHLHIMALQDKPSVLTRIWLCAAPGYD